MATTVQKITLSPSRDIPFNKLVLSQSNVRRVKAGVSVEELAEDIARRGLLQGLSVRPVVDQAGAETGMFEIPAGGRRYRALELLVKQKRLAKTAPVPCVVREGGIAEEDSLAENVQRAPLHPLDQFRAFLALREKGQSEEEIAAAFFISVNVVKQRLKLASVSPALLDVYAEDGMTLDQLMAFTVSGDHERQEQVFERLKASYDKQPYVIRRMLTEGAVRASDKRAQFIGVDAYVEAGGAILRDLFQGDDGGWLQDVALLDRRVADKLKAESETIAAEGWKWIEVAPDFAYGHAFRLRQLRGETVPLTAEEEASRDTLQAEFNRLSDEYADADELPEGVDERLSELETALEGYETRPVMFDPAEIARAGAFVSIAHDGALRVERGFVRPEDELPAEPEADPTTDDETPRAMAASCDSDSVAADEPAPEPEEDEGLSPISDRLLTELTAHRTLGLRQALGEQPDVAFLAALHAITLKTFYHYGSDSCLELDLKSVSFGAQAPGLNDSASAEAISSRHENWAKALPKESADLWDALQGWDGHSRSALFAHVVSLSINAVHEAWSRRPRAFAHADRLAQAVDLDMAAAGWKPTVDNFLGRVTKARILEAVAESKGQRAADRIQHLKKGHMAREAETLLAGAGWLPEPLRTPGRAIGQASSNEDRDAGSASEPVSAETAPDGGETAVSEPEPLTEDEPSWASRMRPQPSSVSNKQCPLGPPAWTAPRSRLRGDPRWRAFFVSEDAMKEKASELARRLAGHAEAVCRRYLSNGRREGRYWLVGDARNTPGRSMFVRLRGSDFGKGAAGKWTDAATGEHGDLLDVIRESRGLADFKDVADEARSFLSLPPPAPGPRRARASSRKPDAPAGSSEAARRLFGMSQPISGALAETYLRRRGITALHETDSLRFHRRCYYRPDKHSPTETWPAMIAAVTDLSGRLTGAHRTWLDPSGFSEARLGKAPVDTPRRAMGDLLGHAVRFGVAGEVMAAGEGIETMLSLRCVLPAMPMVAALSAAHLSAILFPDTLRRLYIARDDDPAGDGAMATLIERAQEAGIEAIVISPWLGDFNEDLRLLGIGTLRAASRVQIAAQDVARFMELTA